VHVLNLASRGNITTQYLNADPVRGFPPARKQAAIDSIAGFLVFLEQILQFDFNKRIYFAGRRRN
jgi:hypothetical protein